MHSLIIDREVLILTLSILLALQGCILYIVHPDTSLAIDLSDLKTFPSAHEIYLNPWEISWSSGMLNPTHGSVHIYTKQCTTTKNKI